MRFALQPGGHDTHAVSLPEMQCDDSTNTQEKKPKGIHVSGQITPEKIE